MNKTKIDWQNPKEGWKLDFTWNPVIGCKHGCSYCYAKKLNDRFKFIENWNEPQLMKIFKKYIKIGFLNILIFIQILLIIGRITEHYQCRNLSWFEIFTPIILFLGTLFVIIIILFIKFIVIKINHT